MIRRHATALRIGLAVVDFVAAVAVFVVVSVLRFGPGWMDSWQAAATNAWLLAASYAASWVVILWLLGLYRLRARWTWRTEVLDLLRAVLIVAILTFATLFVIKLPDVSRLFLVGLFAAQAVVAVGSRGLLRFLLRRARESGRNTRFVLIVGHGEAAQEYARRVERYPYLGLRVAGFLADPGPGDPHPEAPASEALPDAGISPRQPGTLGRIGEIEGVLRSTVIDEVAICLQPEDAAYVEPVARICEEFGLIVRIPLFAGVSGVPGGRVENFDGLRIQTLAHGPDRAIGLLAKRVIDWVGAITALVLFSPVLAVAAIAIRAEGPGPIFFRQERVGLRGRPFRLVKLRTMVPDAEAMLHDLGGLNEISGPAFKLTDDPRVTRVGRILRRTSLDEIPQFWNVIAGDMSVVGPRPPLPGEVQAYDVWHRRRLAMKPGITGLWQISARREEEFDRWVRIDLDYIDRWSLWLDLKIIVRTLPAMLEGR
ncbi:MAG TPA: sugar transferase [Candidatus Limnocylindrales bacterium]|nr:sugar transferase [Candidatus Limnocylindrales bacterium]